MSMSSEDFSFPIIIPENPPCSVDSPPLWNLSPAASPNHNSNPHAQEEEEEEEEEEAKAKAKARARARAKAKASKGSYEQSRKSCSNAELVTADGSKKHYNSEDEEEDKMDILWEDFNEELYSSSTKTKKIHSSSSSSSSFLSPPVGALKLSSRNGTGANFSAGKPGILVFIKLLNKLFRLRHNSPHHRSVHHRSVKK